MHRIDYSKAVMAGLAGTAAFSVFGLILSALGIPGAAPWVMVATFLQAAPLVGWIGHFLIGIGFAVLYAAIAGRVPGSSPASKGAVYGVFVWLVAMILAVPIMMGAPIFAGSVLVALMSLFGHLIYGSVTGAVYSHAYATAPERAAQRARGH